MSTDPDITRTDAPVAALPPPIALYQLAIGHYVSRALDLAARLGLADLLRDAPRSAAELAEASGANAAALRRVLRLLVSVGVFDEDDAGRFSLTPHGRAAALGRRGVDALRGPTVRGSRHPGQLEGARVLRAHGPASLPQDLARRATRSAAWPRSPEQAAVFDEAMAAFTHAHRGRRRGRLRLLPLRARSPTSAAVTARC